MCLILLLFPQVCRNAHLILKAHHMPTDYWSLRNSSSIRPRGLEWETEELASGPGSAL